MLTIKKETLDRYFFAYANTVEEHIGEYDEESSLRYFPIHRLDDAINCAYQKHKRNLEKELESRKNRLWWLANIIYTVRSIWNKKIRRQLRDFKTKTRNLEQTLNLYSPTAVQVNFKPDEFYIEGEALPIGMKFYVVDEFSLQIHEEEIKSSRVSIYNYTTSDSRIYFRGNRYSFDSTEYSPDGFFKMGQWYFFNKDQTREKMQELIEKRISEYKQRLQEIK